jgi:FkbM family methyltransferase
MIFFFRFKLWLKGLISRMLQRLTGPAHKALYLETHSGNFLVPSSDLSLARSISKSGGYVPLLLHEILALVDDSTNALFVGAHVGMFLIPVAKKALSVTGIEANPGTFALLKKNVLLNEVHNAELNCCAAADRRGEIDFIASRENSAASKVLNGTDRRYEFFHDKPSIVRVPTVRLDDELKNRAFDLVVMDIEGMEPKALAGMTSILDRVRHLIIEIHPYSFLYVSHTPPQDFYALIPARFSVAKVIPPLRGRGLFNRRDFLEMHHIILSDRKILGADVIFSAG